MASKPIAKNNSKKPVSAKQAQLLANMLKMKKPMATAMATGPDPDGDNDA